MLCCCDFPLSYPQPCIHKYSDPFPSPDHTVKKSLDGILFSGSACLEIGNYHSVLLSVLHIRRLDVAFFILTSKSQTDWKISHSSCICKRGKTTGQAVPYPKIGETGKCMVFWFTGAETHKWKPLMEPRCDRKTWAVIETFLEIQWGQIWE